MTKIFLTKSLEIKKGIVDNLDGWSNVLLQSCKVLSVSLPETKGMGDGGFLFQRKESHHSLNFFINDKEKSYVFSNMLWKGILGISNLFPYVFKTVRLSLNCWEEKRKNGDVAITGTSLQLPKIWNHELFFLRFIMTKLPFQIVELYQKSKFMCQLNTV